MIQGYENFITDPTIKLEGTITFGNTTWKNGEASVTISTDTTYMLQYQINSISDSWQKLSNGGTVTGLKHGDTIYARLWDGENAGEHASKSIQDKIAPTINSFDVTKKDATSITVDVSAEDNQSGLYSYTFQYKLSTESNYITAATKVSNSGTYTYKYTGLVENKTYDLKVIIEDKAKLTSNRTITQVIVQSNNVPVIDSAKYSSKDTTSITVTSQATDIDGDKLTYKLYTATSQNGSYTLKTTSSEITQGTTVTLTATGLSNYTTYWWYVQVSDGKEIATSSKQSTKTYCPGTGYTCTTTACSGKQTKSCTSCGGDGKVRKTCPGGSTCSKCGGSGNCPGSPVVVGQKSNGTCSCGGTFYRDNYKCYTCGITGYTSYYCNKCGASKGSGTNNHSGASCPKCGGAGKKRCVHDYFSSHQYNDTCSRCNGSGSISTTPCVHGYSSAHRYCNHYDTTTVTTHTYCTHGRTSKHDD